jgi:Rrf2 family protein
LQDVRITTLAEYGVICALHLAQRVADGPITGREIAEFERLPNDYVEQILLRLRRAGIVRSTRGAHGGYALARPASEISIRDVIEASGGHDVRSPLRVASGRGGAVLVVAQLQHSAGLAAAAAQDRRRPPGRSLVRPVGRGE